jgi:hypothetical protein
MVRLRQYRGMARWAMGDLGGGDDLREALRSGLEIGVLQETSPAFTNLSDFVWFAEGPRQGLEIQRRGMDFTERRGHAHGTLWLQAESTWLLYDAGDWDQLLETADAVIAADQQRGGSNITDLVTSYRAKVLVNRGGVAAAADMVERFLPRARETAEPQILLPALLVAGLVRHAQGATDAALALIEELQRASQGRQVFRGAQLTDALRICASAETVPLAERLLADAPEAAARDRFSALSARAVLAEMRGELDTAVETFSEAAGRWASYGHPWEEAHARFGAGRCLLALGRPTEALVSLREARDLFGRLGAGPVIAEVDERLSRAIARTS